MLCYIALLLLSLFVSRQKVSPLQRVAGGFHDKKPNLIQIRCVEDKKIKITSCVLLKNRLAWDELVNEKEILTNPMRNCFHCIWKLCIILLDIHQPYIEYLLGISPIKIPPSV